MNKSFLLVLVFFVFVISNLMIVSAQSDFKITLNGNQINFPDAQPFINENNRTQVPISIIAEYLGATKEWEESTSTAKLVKGSTEINIKVGDYSISKNDKIINMDTKAIILDNRVYIPLRFMAEAFEFDVEWDNAINTINLKSNKMLSDIKQEKDTLSLGLEFMNYMPSDRNYLISPLSIKLAFAMAANGSNGETKKEILDVFGIRDLNQYNEYVKNLIETVNSTTQENYKIEMKIANSIWLNTDFADNKNTCFSPKYESDILNFYKGDSQIVNNSNAVDNINSWVSSKTNKKINKIVSNPNFLAALANTVYFKGEWYLPFNGKNTQKSEFTDKNGLKSQIDFMKQTNFFSYIENDYFNIIKLPYKNKNIAMYFLLPKVAEYVLNKSLLNEELDKMKSTYVTLALPKFKTEFSIDNLKDTLEIMGVKKAFSANAEFSNMFSPSIKTHIDKVIHKTYINVDENGTEASAATILLMTTGYPPTPVNLDLNKPFIYFIRDDASKEILFLGEYAYTE